MPVTNQEVAARFARMADILEIQDANPFRVRAYRNAARLIEGLSRPLAEMVAAGEDLSALSGIGDDLAGKIETLVRGGEPRDLKEAGKDVPEGLLRLLDVPGLGPKRVQALRRALGIRDLEGLRQAAARGALRGIPGFGARTEEKILKALGRMEGPRRRLIADAMAQAEPLLRHLRGAEGVEALEVAGSYRRRRETVGDLDLLAAAGDGSDVMDLFVGHENVDEVQSKGATRSTVLLRGGLQVDLRVVPAESFGAALVYFTGSQAHNIALRRHAQARGLKLNEYGVFRGEERVAGRDEEEVYAAVGLPWIAPELREDEGEIEAAEQGTLPELVRTEDIHGDLHAHTVATDGHDSLPDMAAAAKGLGYEYLAITDHSKRVSVAKGLDASALRRHMEAIGEAADEAGILLLRSVELDILKDGSLDLPDDVLEELDLVVASLHYHLDLPRERQTERLLKAVRHPLVDIIAHPTGRRLNRREGALLDMDRVLQACAEEGCALELNGQPDRLELEARLCRRAKEHGIPIALSTDAHSTGALRRMRLCVDQARRGWLTREDVLNTRPWSGVRKAIKRGR